MTYLILHRFGTKYSKGKKGPNFNREEPDRTKRGYTFGVELDLKDVDTNLTFRQRFNTLTKLNTVKVNKTHIQMQEKSLEVWDYCPSCIAKIKITLGL